MNDSGPADGSWESDGDRVLHRCSWPGVWTPLPAKECQGCQEPIPRFRPIAIRAIKKSGSEDAED